jgi:hypothetical protein
MKYFGIIVGKAKKLLTGLTSFSLMYVRLTNNVPHNGRTEYFSLHSKRE